MEYPGRDPHYFDGIEDITPDQDGGVGKQLLQEGVGDQYPVHGDYISAVYRAYLNDDFLTEFDSNFSVEPYSFHLGKGIVIQGWEVAIPTMRLKEKARITMRSDYAYGKGGIPPRIPPDAVLIYEIELVDFRGEDLSEEGDKSLLRHTIHKGEGWDQPYDESIVTAEILGRYNGREFDNRTVQFTVGQGVDHNVVEGVEIAVKGFKKNEKALILIPPKYGFGPMGCPEFDIPPDAHIEYEVKVLDFINIQAQLFHMNFKEKLDQAEKYKNIGTNYYRDGNYFMAEKFYKKTIMGLEFEIMMDEIQTPRKDRILVQGYLNLALTCLKQGYLYDCKEFCLKALEIDAKNIKAYYRRGQAYEQAKDWNEAKADYEKVLELDPGNTAAEARIEVCHRELHQGLDGERELYKKMMSKLGQPDPKGKKREVTYQSGDVFQQIGEWDNSMAAGMMTLQQECEAFGETMPEKGTNHHEQSQGQG